MEQFEFLERYFRKLSPDEGQIGLNYAWNISQAQGSLCITTDSILSSCLESPTVSRLLSSNKLPKNYLSTVKERLKTHQDRFSAPAVQRKTIEHSCFSPRAAAALREAYRFWEDNARNDEHVPFGCSSLLGGILRDRSGIAMTCLDPLSYSDYSRLFQKYYFPQSSGAR